MLASEKKQPVTFFIWSLIGVLFLTFVMPCRAQNLTLYTPYPKISVSPGEAIDFSVDAINNSGAIKTADMVVAGLPKEWTYELKSGNWNVEQLSVLPNDKKNFSLKVNVPLKVNKGIYRFQVLAKGQGSLPLTIAVSEQGTYKTAFTSNQTNMEGAANSTFTFNTTLRNQTDDHQVYALRARLPEGWNVTFRANGKQVSSVDVEANHMQDVTVEIDPPDEIGSGKYKIPIEVGTSNTSATLEFEVVITGSYKLELTTPTGLLSTTITAGDRKRIPLLVKNTGSADLKNVEMKFTAPANWDVVYEPIKIPFLRAGASLDVFATIQADKKAIAGDYMVNLEAKTAAISSRISYRVAVETSLLWGWLGILIILVALGSVYYLIRKYGRR